MSSALLSFSLSSDINRYSSCPNSPKIYLGCDGGKEYLCDLSKQKKQKIAIVNSTKTNVSSTSSLITLNPQFTANEIEMPKQWQKGDY